MSSYYAVGVDVEGAGIVGVYADSEDEAREFATECDTSDIEIQHLQVTDVRTGKAEKV